MKYPTRILFAFGIVALCSCNSEERKIKEALKATVGESVQNYELKEYKLVETVFAKNISDSISHLESEIFTEQLFMKDDSTKLNQHYATIASNNSKKAGAPAFLRSDWDNINRSYKEWAKEIEDKLAEKWRKIDSIKAKEALWQNLIKDKDDLDVIFNVYSHSYYLNGVYKSEEVSLTPDYKVFKLK